LPTAVKLLPPGVGGGPDGGGRVGAGDKAAPPPPPRAKRIMKTLARTTMSFIMVTTSWL
jgi:hypothetical protein